MDTTLQSVFSRILKVRFIIPPNIKISRSGVVHYLLSLLLLLRLLLRHIRLLRLLLLFINESLVISQPRSFQIPLYSFII